MLERISDRTFSVALVVLLLLGFSHTLFFPFFHVDEGFLLTLAPYSFFGGLYDVITDHKPPFLFQWTYILSLGTGSPLILQVGKCLWMGLGAFAWYASLCRYVDRTRARELSLLFVLTIPLIVYGSYSQERAYLPWLLIGFFFVLKAIESKKNRMLWSYGIVGGACFGLACAIKQPAILLLPPVFVPVLLSSKRWRLMLQLTLGGIGATALSWWASGAPFREIWNQGYAANFSYIDFDSFHSKASTQDVLQNIITVVGLNYAHLILGSMLSIYWFLSQPRAHQKRTHEFWALLLLLLGSVLSVCLGRRFLQQYFVVWTPILVLLCGIGFDRRWFKQTIFSLAAFGVVTYAIYGFQLNLRDQNKNWDSRIRNLIEEIRLDTRPDESIWVGNALHSVYAMSGRRPAVKNLFFQWMLGMTDPCRAPDSVMREHSDDPRYLRNLADLERNRPKVIFWNHRAQNSCSDRLKIENFPMLAKFINAHYRTKWENAFGTYYLLEPTRILWAP